MRCELPMPAQFISTRAMPCAASALASPALTCSSSVTSAWTATPFTSAATFSAFSLLWSSTAIFAPFAAIARGGGAETGATAGDENGNVFQLHGQEPFLGRFRFCWSLKQGDGHWAAAATLSVF